MAALRYFLTAPHETDTLALLQVAGPLSDDVGEHDEEHLAVVRCDPPDSLFFLVPANRAEAKDVEKLGPANRQVVHQLIMRLSSRPSSSPVPGAPLPSLTMGMAARGTAPTVPDSS